MYPSGRKRWIVRFIERKKARQETVGDTAAVDVHKARRIARKRLEAAALHGLPQKPKVIRQKGRSPTFAEVFETFRQDRPYAWAPATERSNLGTMARVLLPHFGTRLIDEITKADVVSWRDSMSDRTGSCNRVIPNLSAILVYAEKLGLRKRGSNPARGLKRYKRAQKTRYLSAAEYRRLDLRLHEFGNERFAAMIRLYIHTGARRGELGASISRFGRIYPLQAIVVQLLIATGCRRDEIRCMKWQQVRGSRLKIIDGKTGPRTVQLCSGAQQLLECLRRGKPDDYVFASSAGQPIALDLFWSKVRDDCNLRNVRLHDLRHSYASRAARLGLPLPVAKQLLGHTKIENTARYTHFDDTHLFEIADFISGLIDDAMAGRVPKRDSLKYLIQSDIS